ncbi:MAG: hypothetical protein U0835_16275 [Isosphaeraceae bacterium]
MYDRLLVVLTGRDKDTAHAMTPRTAACSRSSSTPTPACPTPGEQA